MLTGSLSVSLAVPSTQLVSRPLAHATRRHGLRTAHHGVRMEDDGSDESSFERVYQQNFESGATTTAPAELGAEFVGSVVATADISAAAALKQSAKEAEAEAEADATLPLERSDLAAATKEIREALAVLKAESEAKAAAAASPDKASALSHAALRAKSSQSAPWIQPGLKPLPPTALHQWVHEHDEEASVSEVPPSDTSVWAQFPESSSSPAEDGDWLNWPEQLLLRGTEAVGPPSPLCISRE